MLIFHSQAEAEFRQAIAWYREQDALIAEQFCLALSATIDAIQTDPNSHPVYRRGFRYRRVRHFPYVIYFDVHAVDVVGIYAVAHTSRRTGYWSRRHFD